MPAGTSSSTPGRMRKPPRGRADRAGDSKLFRFDDAVDDVVNVDPEVAMVWTPDGSRRGFREAARGDERALAHARRAPGLLTMASRLT